MRSKSILIFSLGFVVTLFCLHPLQGSTDSSKSASVKTDPGSMKQSLKTLEGEIRAVKVQNHSLTLKAGHEMELVSFDDQTKITESGRRFPRLSLARGENATIKYVEQDGKMLAKRVYLRESRHAGIHRNTKSM